MRIRIPLLAYMRFRVRLFSCSGSGSSFSSSSKWCQSATTGLQTLQGSILNLQAYIVSFHGPPWLHLESLKLINFDLNEDPDPAFHSNADPDSFSHSFSMRIRNPAFKPPVLWFGKKKINQVSALTAYRKRFLCMSHSPAKYCTVLYSPYQTWRIFVEDTGPLVIISFSWVASHLPRPTTKHDCLFQISEQKIFPGSITALLVQYGRKAPFLSHNLKPVRSLLV
jgi:hypothetical protein